MDLTPPVFGISVLLVRKNIISSKKNSKRLFMKAPYNFITHNNKLTSKKNYEYLFIR